MKIHLFAFLFLTIACGKSPKKKDAVYTGHSEMSEEEYRASLAEKKLEAPVDPTPNEKTATPNENQSEDSLESDKSYTNPDETLSAPKPTVKKPIGVGVLSVITATTETTTSHSSCTATLINGSELITAAHCVPFSEGGAQDYCSKMSFIHANEPVPFSCSEVLWSSSSLSSTDITKTHTSTASADILIIKLNAAPKNISSYSLDNELSPDSDLLKVFVYTTNVMKTEGYSVSNLLNSFNDFNFAGYTNCNYADGSRGSYPYRSFNCPIVEGNSGGPVINSSNKIQGIVSGCINPVDSKCTNGNSGGYMTDVGCLEKVKGKYRWKDSCIKEGFVNIQTPLLTSN